MCQLMIQCKAAIKPYLVTLCSTSVTAESNFTADIYINCKDDININMNIEHYLLSLFVSQELFFSLILDVE